MKFVVTAQVDDHTISVTAKSMKEAMAQAVEWKLVERFRDIIISHGTNRYSIEEFATRIANRGKSD
jgi:hypothetical protein